MNKVSNSPLCNNPSLIFSPISLSLSYNPVFLLDFKAHSFIEDQVSYNYINPLDSATSFLFSFDDTEALEMFRCLFKSLSFDTSDGTCKRKFSLSQATPSPVVLTPTQCPVLPLTTVWNAVLPSSMIRENVFQNALKEKYQCWDFVSLITLISPTQLN